MDYDDIIARFESLTDKAAVEGMSRYGITGSKVYGIKIPVLRKLAKEAGKRNHELALRLWSHGSREARIVASLIEDPKQLTEQQMDAWVQDFDSWEVCDQTIMNLFEKVPSSWGKAIQWSRAGEEFVKRAGFVMMARLGVSDKKAGDSKFETFLPIIKRGASDNRNFVKKAVNWALRQIGKRNGHLNAKALETAYEILHIDAKSAQWIARDAIRELESDAVRKRLGLL